ncbi:MAG: Fur family transcriptional regulator [Hyphomicrobiales bacterium]
MSKALFPAPDHDHTACVEQSLARARGRFEERGERLTSLREAVFKTLAESHEALGAYDIIEKMRARGRRIAPISMYRVLDVLCQAGLVHRIESRNAFVACHDAGCEERPMLFLVCERCGRVAETHDDSLGDTLKKLARSAGFRPRQMVLELSGVCSHCSN